MIKVLIILGVVAVLGGCGHKKFIAKNCEKVQNAEVFVCDKF
jgi:hypothetical protein